MIVLDVDGRVRKMGRMDEKPCRCCNSTPPGASRADWSPDTHCKACGAHGQIGPDAAQYPWGQLCTRLETLLLSEGDSDRCERFREVMREAFEIGKQTR
jgi:hypothetical protein